MGSRAKFYLDLLERSIWSGVQGFFGAMLVDGWLDKVKLSTEEQLWFAAATGGLAVAKCIVSAQLPWAGRDNASSLPATVEP